MKERKNYRKSIHTLNWLNLELKGRSVKFPKIKSKNKRRSVKAKALRLWSIYIRKRAFGLCEYCGKKCRDAHHIIPRGTSIKSGWFMYDNGIALCFQCHRVHGPHSLDFDEQVKFNNWVRSYLSKKNIDYDRLKVICKARGGLTISDMELLCDQIKRDIERLT